ncbi:MAG: adenylate/guanylate cyclase domain-containing protein [Nitrospirota bacterium]
MSRDPEGPPVEEEILAKDAESHASDAVDGAMATADHLMTQTDGMTPGQAAEYVKEATGLQRVRGGIRRVTGSRIYETIQRTATYTSIFAEPTLRFGASQAGVQVDEGVYDVIRLTATGVFATNLVAKTAGNGLQHLKSAEGLIDAITVAAETMQGLPIGNARLARLLKQIRTMRTVSKVMRTMRLGALDESLEDKATEEIVEGFSKAMVGILGVALPLLGADFKNLDFTDPATYAKFIAGNGVIILMAKQYVKTIRGALQSNYTELLEESISRIDKIRRDNPELESVLSEVLKKGQNEVLILVEAFASTLVDLKTLINPIGEDFELDEDGGLKSKDLDAVVMVTDLREFTRLSESIGGEIFTFLKTNYFSFLKKVIKQYKGKILNHTGDGLVVYFTNAVDKDGEVTETKESMASKCAAKVNEVTNMMANSFLQEDYGKVDSMHYTGVGMSRGVIRIGDALSLATAESATCGDTEEDAKNRRMFRVHESLQAQIAKECEWLTDGGIKDIASLVGIGNPINMAARLESQAKNYPDYNCLITEELYENLPYEEKANYTKLGEQMLKGIAEPIAIYGIPRHKQTT